MESTAQELLHLIAEVSIATVALSGITMVLAISGTKIKAERTGQITSQLRMAFMVVVLAIVPLLLAHAGLADEQLWRIATATYIASICYVIGRSAMRSEGYEKPPASSIRLVTSVASVGLVLLPMNLWLAKSWPYLTQLCLAWSVSMGLFIRFIYDVLSERQEREEA